jgi:hypothetical protein
MKKNDIEAYKKKLLEEVNPNEQAKILKQIALLEDVDAIYNEHRIGDDSGN